MFQSMFQTFLGRRPRYPRSSLLLPFIWITTCHRFVSAFPFVQGPILKWAIPSDKPCIPARGLDTLVRRQHFPVKTCAIKTTTTTTSTSCHLFFRSSQDQAAPQFGPSASIDPSVLLELESPNCILPFTIAMPDNNRHQNVLKVRFMTRKDLPTILALCIDEFGFGTTLTVFDLPWNDWSRVPNWWDRVTFEPYITLSLLSKMNANLNNAQRKNTPIKDPAILVLSQRNNRNYDDDDDDQEQVIGMVEVSLQLPNPNRNPPSFPVPLWIKEWWCRFYPSQQGKQDITSNPTRLQGWVTNVLIDPNYRGLGYAKILMAATEGIARKWNCDSIYLHADADYRSGKVAQTLYQGLGYQVVTDTDSDYTWMKKGTKSPFSSIRMIEGVPLLCFRKDLARRRNNAT